MSSLNIEHEGLNVSRTGCCGCDEMVVARILFIAIGIGYLFPFSALTQPVDYWTLLFPDFDVEFPITAVYMWTNLILLFLIVFFGNAKPHYGLRIYTGFVGQFFSLVVVPTSYFYGLSESGNYAIIMLCTAFAASVTAGIDSCIISLASLYPTSCQEALQIGIGVSTLIGSVYRILTKLYFPADAVVASSLLYFYSGALTVLVCIACYYYLGKLSLTQRCVYDGADTELLQITSGGSPVHSPMLGGGRRKDGYGAVAEEEGRGRSNTAEVESYNTKRRTAFMKVWWNELMVLIVFSTTLALWPPLVSEIPSYDFPYLNETEWWPLILLFNFALMDVIGRFSVPFRAGITADNIHYYVFLRIVVFVPAIIACVKGTIHSDLASILFVAALGFTNGYIGSLSIVLINERVHVDERGIVGSLTGFTLNAGLVLGATFAIFVNKAVSGH
jgi:equilibrative nucleoside transporter 1/2/3